MSVMSVLPLRRTSPRLHKCSQVSTFPVKTECDGEEGGVLKQYLDTLAKPVCTVVMIFLAFASKTEVEF